MSVKFDKGGKFSSRLLSLIIVLTLFGFSGSPTQPVSQKPTHAESQFRTTGRSKIHSCFNQLRSGLISKNFFDVLSQRDAIQFEHQLKQALFTAFGQVSQICNSFITFSESIRFLHRARSFDNALVLLG